ncbi:MAG: SusC/RagA family TonB-linked outer membrane protein [Bacteroidales bacterium]
MTKKYNATAFLFIMIMLFTGMISPPVSAQESGTEITGVVTESGTGLALAQVSISVASTGVSNSTDEQGVFTLLVPDLKSQIIVNLPGYTTRNIYLNGREHVEITLVRDNYQSPDNSYNTPLGTAVLKDATFAATSLTRRDLKFTKVSSFDQALQGRVAGMSVINRNGMPGSRTFMNIRGYSSLYANNEPLLFIDGMIHDYAYATTSLMEGYALNPMDVVDMDDISDISVLKDGISFLGSAGSNGAIYVNTEQKAEASTVIKFGAYGGITMTPKNQELLNPSQFNTYFEDLLVGQGYNSDQINSMYPWLHGDASSEDYYKYHNETDWQEELYSPSAISKFHFFLKGGDDIATYNVSTGYLSQKGIYENSGYSRFNLRINGKVNITDKFSVTPNVKLSLADSRIANHGSETWKNPILSTVMKSPVMDPIARDGATGEYLTYFDDVGVFNVSNPSAITSEALGTNRNYHFLSSIKAEYRFNEHFNLSTLFGINFNNARETIFLPDQGIVQVDSAYNSPGDMVYDFRSSQNHSMLTYTNTSESGHSILANLGFRYMKNSYKYNQSLDLNTPSDFFRSLGDGSQYSFLRSTTGDNRELSWVSYFADINYSFRNKYFASANLSYDGSSVTNETNRYNLYPSFAAAWRLSSESFLNQAGWLEDLKLRGSWSQTGNMYSTIYDYSKLYYTDRRINSLGVLHREVIPNENLELEKKSTIDIGLDLSLFRQSLNIRADYFISSVDNLVIRQELPMSFGYTNYYDNGGKLASSGLEIAADARVVAGNFEWIIGGTVSKITTEVTSLEFLNPAEEQIVTSIPGAQFVTSEGNAVNAYYGYQTNGIISASEAGTITGPKGTLMEAGDVKYMDFDGNTIINEADKTIIGDPNPDLFGSIFTSLAYKNLELYVRFNYSMGNDLFNFMRYQTESMSNYSNQSVSVLDRWTPSNTGAEMPRAIYGDPNGNSVFSDRWIEDGSFMKLSQVTLSYFLPSIGGVFNGVTFYVTATNLLTFTNYSGYDPEFSYLNNPFYQGVDYGMMPGTQSFIVGLKLDL